MVGASGASTTCMQTLRSFPASCFLLPAYRFLSWPSRALRVSPDFCTVPVAVIHA